MSSTRIFVVEDEPLIREDMMATLEELGYEVVGSAANAEQALEGIKNSEPDLSLLDIEIDGVLDGIDLAHQINSSVYVPFIFITAFYDEKTLARARATNPAGYIVKPWDEHNLKANIEVALAKKRVIKQEEKETNPLFIKHNGKLVSVNPKEILFAESYDNYAFIYTEDQKILATQTLKTIGEKLEPEGFVRVHKSWLANLKAIDSISEGRVYIAGREIPLGRAYKAALFEKIELI